MKKVKKYKLKQEIKEILFTFLIFAGLTILLVLENKSNQLDYQKCINENGFKCSDLLK